MKISTGPTPHHREWMAQMPALQQTMVKTPVMKSHFCFYLKVVIRYYNTLGCWVDGANDSATKHLMFQVLFLFFL